MAEYQVHPAIDEDGNDVYDWADLFCGCEVNVAPYQSPELVALVDDGEGGAEVVGALVAGDPHGEGFSSWFSVVVDHYWRRKGVATALVEQFADDKNADGLEVTAHVINDEAMIPLLEGLGFAHEGGPLWSR